MSLVFFRFAFAALIIAVIMMLAKIPFKVTRVQFFQLVTFGMLGGGLTAFLLFCSYLYMPVGIATMFHFGYPLFVTLIMTFIFKEKCTIIKVVAVALALAGMVLMADLRGSFSPMGVFLSVLSGVTVAIYVVAMKKSSFGTLHPIAIVFYVSSFSAVFLGSWIFVTDSLTVPSTPEIWLFVMILAILCTVVTHCLFTFGVQRLGATRSSIISMMEPLTSIIAGAWFLKEFPGIWAIVGCLMVGACVVLVMMEKDVKEEIKEQTDRV